jgi:hypothetical protein
MKISVSEFKEVAKTSKITFNKSKVTNKIFAISGDKCYRCAQNLDIHKPIMFLFDSGSLDTGCFINAQPNVIELGTL